MFIISVEGVLAATYNWDVIKTPGHSNTVSDTVKMPLFKGQITYKVTSLSGNCSYLVAKVTATKSGYYNINTSSKSVMITKVGGQQAFTMYYTDKGSKEEFVYFNCTIEHNASIGELVCGAGTLSH